MPTTRNVGILVRGALTSVVRSVGIWCNREDRGRLLGLFLVHLFTVIAGGVALVTYRAQVVSASQTSARDEFTSIYTNLGSDKLFERLGALQQVPDVMFRKSPSTNAPPHLLSAPPSDLVYFDRCKRAFVNYLQIRSETSAPDNQLPSLVQSEFFAILDTLSRIGQRGWKEGKRSTLTTKEDALNWIWQLNPEKGTLDYELKVSLAKLPWRNLNLGDIGFVGAALSAPDFTNSNLELAKFSTARLKKPTFSKCSLVGGRFDKVQFSKALFVECDFSSSRFLGASIDGAQISKCNGLRVSFGAGERLKNLGDSAPSVGQFSARQVTASEWSIGDADFCNAWLTGWRINESSFSGCDFERAICSDVAFVSSELTECTFDNSTLKHLRYENSAIRRCSFKNAVIEGGSFMGTKVTGSDFSNTHFRDVGFSSFVALTTNTKFLGAVFERPQGLSTSDIATLRNLGAIIR